MKQVTIFFFAVSSFFLGSCHQEQTPVAAYDVIWDSPSDNSRGSMPAGNGDIGANVWVDPAGDLRFYISKTDAWSEYGSLLKIGRIKLKFTPNLLAAGEFRQELDLASGLIRITGKQGGQTLSLELWVDANAPVVHVEGHSTVPVSVDVLYDGWRRQPRELEGEETFSAYGVMNGTSPIISEPDTLLSRANKLVWCHHNRRSIWKETLAVQSLDAFAATEKDPLLHRTFGASVSGKGLASKSPEALTTEQAVKDIRLDVVVLTRQDTSVDEWETAVNQLADASAAESFAKQKARHRKYWKDVWDAGYIYVDSPVDSLNVYGMTRGYVLQRYLNVCGGRGNMPVKFNGSIFNVDSVDARHPYDADYRSWGGCYWWQNTRLPYWAMLYTGDFELMKPLFKMYVEALPLAKYRTKQYYGHEGAFFSETMYFWGTYNNDNYGWDRKGKPDGLTDNRYIRYEWQGGIELVSMMLDYYDFTQDRAFLRDTILPVASEVIKFYRRHYPRGADGKILLEPAQALETWWDITNPTPEVAGLRFILPRLMRLDELLVDTGFRKQCQTMLDDLPELPAGEKDGEKILLPGLNLKDKTNVENPELYALFPYRLYGVGKPSLELAANTFARRQQKDYRGWQQNAIQAALIGDAEEAAAMVSDNFNTKNEGSRFPAFWGPNYDWVPDQDHGSVNMRALQNMLVQTEDEDIILFPAWPESWNVTFKVWAPRQTVIEGRLENGKITRLNVTPESRKKDVRIWNDRSE